MRTAECSKKVGSVILQVTRTVGRESKSFSMIELSMIAFNMKEPSDQEPLIFGRHRRGIVKGAMHVWQEEL